MYTRKYIVTTEVLKSIRSGEWSIKTVVFNRSARAREYWNYISNKIIDDASAGVIDDFKISANFIVED